MTEYELVDTFYTIAALSDQLIASFITLLFAFLIASYLVSAKLDHRMMVIVIALYSFMALRYVVLYHNVTGDIASLANTLMELRLQEGTSLGWLKIQGGIRFVNTATAVAMFLGYLASLTFFYYTRHRSRN